MPKKAAKGINPSNTQKGSLDLRRAARRKQPRKRKPQRNAERQTSLAIKKKPARCHRRAGFLFTTINIICGTFYPPVTFNYSPRHLKSRIFSRESTGSGLASIT